MNDMSGNSGDAATKRDVSRGDFMRYVNTGLLGLVTFFMIQFYGEVRKGTDRLELMDKTQTLHGYRVDKLEVSLDREISKLQREIDTLRRPGK